MPNIYFPNDEYEALKNVYNHEERVNWGAYEKARRRIQRHRVVPEAQDDAPSMTLAAEASQ